MIPEINAEDIKKHKGSSPTPNCSDDHPTSRLAAAQGPTNDRAELVVQHTAASGAASRHARDDRTGQRGSSRGKPVTWQDAPNISCVQRVTPRLEVGQRLQRGKMKLLNETRKILPPPDIRVTLPADAACRSCDPPADEHSNSIYEPDYTDRGEGASREGPRRDIITTARPTASDANDPPANDVSPAASASDIYDPATNRGIRSLVAGDSDPQGAPALNAVRID